MPSSAVFYTFITLIMTYTFTKAYSIDEQPNQKKVLIYFIGLGEYQWAKRLEKVFQIKNFETKVHIGDPQKVNSKDKAVLIDAYEYQDLDQLEKNFQPNIILEINQSCASTNHPCRWLIFHDPQRIDDYFSNSPKLVYKGLVVPSETSKYDHLKNTYKILEGYPSHQNKEFSPLAFKDIFFCGFMWDSKRNSKEIKNFLAILAKNDLLSVYGPEKKWKFIRQAYKGYLPFEADSIFNATQASGITLILHSDQHLNSGIPTARIFEAAAASSVVIADEHPFIKKHFGDSVLYIDTNLDAKNLAKEVSQHYKWIQKNPKKAQELAKRAHEIFSKQFSIEKVIDEILEESKID